MCFHCPNDESTKKIHLLANTVKITVPINKLVLMEHVAAKIRLVVVED